MKVSNAKDDSSIPNPATSRGKGRYRGMAEGVQAGAAPQFSGLSPARAGKGGKGTILVNLLFITLLTPVMTRVAYIVKVSFWALAAGTGKEMDDFLEWADLDRGLCRILRHVHRFRASKAMACILPIKNLPEV